MGDEPDGYIFAIYPSSEPNLPVGIESTNPSWHFSFVGAPVYEWKCEKVGDYYRFSLGTYPYIGLVEERVIASINPQDEEDWIIRREPEGAYTITLARDPSLAWTVSRDSGKRQLIALRSITPKSYPDQLFLFERLYE